MRVALAQLNYTVGGIEINKTKIINSIQRAKSEGAELVLFAEYAISGANCYSLLARSSFQEACEEALVEIASHCDNITAIVGMPLLQDNNVVSVAAIIQNRVVIRYIGKRRVTLSDECAYVKSARGVSENINVNGHKVAVVVGEDIVKEGVFGAYADTVIGIWAHPYSKGVIAPRYEIARALAYRHRKSIIFMNHQGGQADTIYDGSSCVYNLEGRPISYLKSFEEDFALVDLDSKEQVVMPTMSAIEEIHKALKLGLRDYFEKNGFKKACLGLSGGIDSAVVLALVAEVLEPQNIKALLMPSHFSSDHSVDDAIVMARNLGVEYEVVSITEAYTTILKSMEKVIGGTEFDVTEENIQARIRCVMLMALSNKHGHILLNTSNKSESAVGYGTLYGDMGGSLAVMGDLYKNEVYALARYLNRDKEVIPQNIVIKEPSAELHPNQKDSDSLPPYDTLDAILYRLIEQNQTVEQIIEAGFDSCVVDKIVRQLKNSEHKRRQAAPMLKLSRSSFVDGFKLPLLHKF